MGQSGEAYIQAKAFTMNRLLMNDWKISETLTYLGFPCEIKPINDGTATTS